MRARVYQRRTNLHESYILLFAHAQILVKQCIGLMKAMSGNDDVKFTVMKTEAPQLIVMALQEHIDSPSVRRSLLRCILLNSSTVV